MGRLFVDPATLPAALENLGVERDDFMSAMKRVQPSPYAR
jgi:SpoVK/Ycf46/Vps4 family AAA+-type ATPase